MLLREHYFTGIAALLRDKIARKLVLTVNYSAVRVSLKRSIHCQFPGVNSRTFLSRARRTVNPFQQAAARCQISACAVNQCASILHITKINLINILNKLFKSTTF